MDEKDPTQEHHTENDETLPLSHEGITHIRAGITERIHAATDDSSAASKDRDSDALKQWDSIREHLKEKRYEAAIKIAGLYKDAGHPEGKKVATHVMQTVLADLSYNKYAYPSLEDDSVRDKYISTNEYGNQHDERGRYKFDLIKEWIRLPQEERDAAVNVVIHDILSGLRDQLQGGNKSYDGKRLGTYGYSDRIFHIQYNLPIQSPELLEKIQETIKEMAAHFFIYNEIGSYERLCYAFKIPQEQQKYALLAMEQFFDSVNDAPHGNVAENIIRLQKDCSVPITPDLQEKALILLETCVGIVNSPYKKLIEAFNLPEEEVHAVMVRIANQHLKNHEKKEKPSQETKKSAGRWACGYVTQLMEEYDIDVGEIDFLAASAEQMEKACTSNGDDTQ